MDSEAAAEVVIPLSKGKILLLLLGAVTLVIVGLWLWSYADSQKRHDPLYLKCIAVADVVFFGICIVYGCIKAFDRRAGLIIDETGIVDNSSGVSAGRILWEEITGLKLLRISGQQFLVIDVADPKKFLARGNFFARILKAANAKLTGSPISISSNTLRVDFDELLLLLAEGFEKHGERN